MTPNVTSAVRAAAKEIVGDLDAYAKAFQLDWPPNRDSYALAVSDIILRHVEPIVRAVEGERDQFHANYCAEQMISESLPSYEALKQVTAERDQALAKLAAVEGEANRIAGEHIGQLAAVSVKLAAVEAHAVPADCDVRKILLEIYNTLESDHEERYAKNVGEVEDEMTKMQAQLDAANDNVREIADLLHQVCRALGVNLRAGAANNQHVVERAKYFAEQFTGERYTATESALARAEQSEALLREALPAIDDRFCPKDLKRRIDNHLTPKANP